VTNDPQTLTKKQAHPQGQPTPTTFITGDRLCASCGYNLIGQAISREPHYGLLIARCPECGVTAAVQEYPLLGRWAHRWALVLAAVWLLLMVAGWVGTSGMLMGLGLAASETAAQPYSSFIQQVFSQVESQAKLQAAAGTTPNSGPTTSLPPGTIVIQRSGGLQQITTIGGLLGGSAGFEKWWAAQDHADLLRQAGGWRVGLTAQTIVVWVFSALAMLAVGWVWATILVQLNRRRLLLWGGLILLLAAVFAAVPIIECLTTEPSWVWIAGRNQMTPSYLTMSMAIFFAGLAVGLCTGRSVARFMIRMLLPPRMRYSLAVLWTCDGHDLPKLHRVYH